MEPRENNTNNPYPAQNIRKPRKVYDQRINDDWEYLDEEFADPYESSDKSFNRSYQQTGLGANIKNTDKKNDQSKKQSRGTNSQNNNQNNNDIDSARNTLNSQSAKGMRKAVLTAIEKSKTVQKTLTIANQRKALAVNRSIVYWAGYIWLFVQAPIALIGIVFFGIIGGLSKLGEVLNSNVVTKTVKDAAETVGTFLGFQLDNVLEAMFFITQILIIAIGLITILVVYIQHTLALNKPLGGRGAGFKIGTLLIVFIGYATPVVNILPWILVWLLAIQKYPR